MNRFVFLTGLPRTGSTVLGALLNQHPFLYPTETSMIHHHISDISTTFVGDYFLYDTNDPNSRLWGLVRGVLQGAYEHVKGKVIIEKSRGWSSEIDTLKKSLSEPPKFIATVRSIPEIISSFILLANKIGDESKIHAQLRETGYPITTWNLSHFIWEKYIEADWQSFRQAYKANTDLFYLIEYDDLVQKPEEVLNGLYFFIEVPPIKVHTDFLTRGAVENDKAFGLPGLHDIRSNLSRTSPSALEVLGEECYNFWEKQHMEFWRG